MLLKVCAHFKEITPESLIDRSSRTANRQSLREKLRWGSGETLERFAVTIVRLDGLAKL